MNYADKLPITAAGLVDQAERCVCRWDDVPDPADTDWRDYGRNYPKSVVRITYQRHCPYPTHAQKADHHHVRYIRFRDDGGVEDVTLV